LSLARWIAVIDEFATREEMVSTADYSGPGTPGTKPGQLSRRVVEMNAAGFVLRDRKWEYTGTGTVVSGGGLGEEFRYRTVEQYFKDTANELPAPPPSGADELAFVRHDLLLVQHR